MPSNPTAAFRRKLLVLGATLPPASLLQAQSNQPIRIGSSLALTGPLSSAGMLHKIAGEIYVEKLNSGGGLLGRPVEWIVKDDQSKPDLARTLYEQLVTVTKADLLLGPYGTANILAAIGVAQRYRKLLIHHSFGIPNLAKYELQFPAWGIGPVPETTFPNTVFDALAATAKPPKTIAIVTSKFPSAHFLSVGARAVAKSRALSELLYLEWEFGNRDFGAIASRLKAANPDVIWVGSIGLEGSLLIDACKRIDYFPPLHVHLYPAPQPMAKSPDTQGALAAALFEAHLPFTDNPEVREFVTKFSERAEQAKLPDSTVETQAAASYVAWQMFEASIRATKSIDDLTLAGWLKKNTVDSIVGKLRFDGPNNYGDDHLRLKQVQNGKWVIVWPRQYAPPGTQIIVK
jgi:branched-chain amino acid transport system substrate-binding protein